MTEVGGFMPVDTRSVDDLGRVVIPRTLRLKYDIQEGDEIVFLDNGQYIGIERAQASCVVCRSLEDLVHLHGEDGHAICAGCLEQLKSMSF